MAKKVANGRSAAADENEEVSIDGSLIEPAYTALGITNQDGAAELLGLRDARELRKYLKKNSVAERWLANHIAQKLKLGREFFVAALSRDGLIRLAGGSSTDAPIAGEGPLQDFDCSLDPSPEHNGNCPLALQWADASSASYTHANVCKFSEDKYFLRVDFKNCVDAYPGNVGIHPQYMRQRLLDDEQRTIEFRVLLLKNDNPNRKICMTIRLSDRLHQQWEYMRSGNVYHVFPIGTAPSKEAKCAIEGDRWRVTEIPPLNEWTRIRVWRASDEAEVFWAPFDHRNNISELDTISRITLEFGHPRNNRRLSGGSGTVLISPIVLGAGGKDDPTLAQ